MRGKLDTDTLLYIVLALVIVWLVLQVISETLAIFSTLLGPFSTLFGLVIVVVILLYLFDYI